MKRGLSGVTGVALVALLISGALLWQSQAPANSPAELLEVKAVLTSAPRVPPPVDRTGNARVIVTLETTETKGTLADGVQYTFWTFGGTVPGPFVRVRVGDLVQIRLKNAERSMHPHSIDLHAVTLGGLALRQRPEPLEIPDDEGATLVDEQSCFQPAAHDADGRLDGGASHVGEALPREMEGERHPVLPSCALALGQAQERRGQPRLHRIHRERLHRVVSRAEPAPDHERHLEGAWMPIGEGEHGIGGDLDDHGGLRGLRGRRVWPVLDDGDAAEYLARPQQLEDDILAGFELRRIFTWPVLTR